MTNQTEVVQLNLRNRLFNAMKNRRGSAIAKGMASAAGARLLVSAVSLATLPLAVRYLGAERYGLWVTITTITSWIAMLELGVSDTLTNVISTSFARNDNKTAASHTTNAIAVTLVLSAIIGSIGAVIWKIVNWQDLLKISPSVDEGEVRATLGIALALVLLAPTCALGAKILSGYQETYIYNAATAAGAVASLLGMATGVYLHFSMPALFLTTAGLVTASGLATLLWTLLVRKYWLRPSFEYLNLRITRNLLSQGWSFFVTQIACLVIFSTDNIIIAHFCGAAEVTPYSVGMKLVGYAQLLPTLLFPSLWPAYAEAHARGDYDWIRRTFRLAMKGSIVTIAIILPVAVLFGRRVIYALAGPEAVPSESLLLAMAVWVLLIAITGVQSCLINAVGRNRILALFVATSAVINLILSIHLVKRIGPLGAVLGTIGSYLLVMIVPQTWLTNCYFRDVLSTTRRGNSSAGDEIENTTEISSPNPA